MQMIRSMLVAAALIAVPAGATTLLDGSFEIEGAATPVTDYCYRQFSSPGGPACTGGSWGPDSGVIISGSGPWGGTTTPDGTYFGFIQMRSVVAQTFTADANATGVVSWIDTNRGGFGGIQSYDVTIFDGTTTTLIGSYTSAVGGWVNRSSSSFALVNGTTYTLSFIGLAQDDSTSFIDSVALGTTPVPEASTWAMLVAGFGLVGAAARRRRPTIAA
jgi:hypothetical protein